MTSITMPATDTMSRVPGGCRRCGWRGHLLKVGRRGRALLGVGRGLRLLCDDCLADLVGSAHRDLVGMASGRAPSYRGHQPKAKTAQTVVSEPSRVRDQDKDLVTV